MPVAFRLKSKEMQAVQWSGSNWHEMLEVFGDVVSTNGKDLFIHFPGGAAERFVLQPGEWLSTDMNVYGEEGIAAHWDRVEE